MTEPTKEEMQRFIDIAKLGFIAGVESNDAALLCGTCTGNPISGKPCICGGAGTVTGEVQGFRERCYELEAENKRLRTALENIMKHQTCVVPRGAHMSGTYRIAKEALK